MASDWHKKTQAKIKDEFKKKGYDVSHEKGIGFRGQITRENRFKQVDLLAEKQNETILIEIEDRKYETKKVRREYGVTYTELGGILLLSNLYSILNPEKKVKLLLVFKETLLDLDFRRRNITEIVKRYQELSNFHVDIQYRNENGDKLEEE